MLSLTKLAPESHLQMRAPWQQDFLLYGLVAAFGLALHMGSWFSPPVSNPMLVKALYTQIVMAAMGCFWLWINRREPLLILSSWPRWLWLGFFLWCTASVIWAVNVDFYVFKWFMLLSAAWVFFFSLQLNTDEYEQRLIAWICTFCILITPLALLQIYFDFNYLVQSYKPAATFNNKNMLAQIMALSLPICLYVFLRQTTAWRSWFYAVGFGLLLLVLFHTQTRAAWISGSFGLLCFFVLSALDWRELRSLICAHRYKVLILPAALLMSITLMNFNAHGYSSATSLVASRTSDIVRDARDNSSLHANPRYLIWQAGLEMAEKHPIVGSGLGGFFGNVLGDEFINYRMQRTLRVHNDVLETLVETGAIGLLLLLGALASAAYCGIRLLQKLRGAARLRYVALGCSLASLAVNAQFSFPFQMATPLMLAACWLALIIRGAERLSPPPCVQVTLQRFRPLFGWAFFGISALVLALVVVVNAQWWNDYTALNRYITRGGVKPYVLNSWAPHQENAPVLWSLGGSLMGVGRYQEVLYVLEPIREMWPDNYVTRNMRFHALRALKRYSQARTEAEPLLNYTHRGLFSPYANLFSLCLILQDVNCAYTTYERLSAVDDADKQKHVGVYRYLAAMSAIMGLPSAPDDYARMRDEIGSNSNVESAVADYYLRQTPPDTVNARIHIDRLEQMDPNNRELGRLRHTAARREAEAKLNSQQPQ